MTHKYLEKIYFGDKVHTIVLVNNAGLVFSNVQCPEIEMVVEI